MTEIYSSGIVESELSRNGSFASVTKGVSMRPLFSTCRDMIVVKPLASPPKKYDVVLYRGAGGEYILHRIIKVRDDLYIIRGDNTYSKEYVPKDAVIGVLTSFNRKGKSGSPASFSFKLYSRLWNFIYPLRYLYVKGISVLRRIYRKICFKNFKKK